jgi:hypothetical protein
MIINIIFLFIIFAGLPVPNGKAHASEIAKMALRFEFFKMFSKHTKLCFAK